MKTLATALLLSTLLTANAAAGQSGKLQLWQQIDTQSAVIAKEAEAVCYMPQLIDNEIKPELGFSEKYCEVLTERMNWEWNTYKSDAEVAYQFVGLNRYGNM